MTLGLTCGCISKAAAEVKAESKAKTEAEAKAAAEKAAAERAAAEKAAESLQGQKSVMSIRSALLGGLPRLNLATSVAGAGSDGEQQSIQALRKMLSPATVLISPTFSKRGESLLEQHSEKLRFFDRWVAAVDQGKLELQIEALTLQNVRLQEQLERERDKRFADASERDDRQIALGTAVAERLFTLRAISADVAFNLFLASTRKTVTEQGGQDEEVRKAVIAEHAKDEKEKYHLLEADLKASLEKNSEKDLVAMRADWDKTLGDLNVKSRELTDAQHEIAELKRKIECDTENIAHSNAEIQRITSELIHEKLVLKKTEKDEKDKANSLETSWKKAVLQRDGLQEQLDKMQKDWSKTKTEVDVLNERLTNSQRQVESLNHDNDSLQSTKREAQEANDRRMRELEESLTSAAQKAAAEKAAADAKAAAEAKAMAEAKAEAEAKASAEKAEAEKAAAEHAAAENKFFIENLEKVAADKAAAEKELKLELESLKFDLEQSLLLQENVQKHAQDTERKWAQTCRELENRLEKLETERRALQNAIEEHKKGKREDDDPIDTIATELQNCRKQAMDMDLQKESIALELSDAIALSKRLTDVVETFKHQCDLRDIKIDQLNVQLDEKESELIKIRDLLKSMGDFAQNQEGRVREIEEFFVQETKRLQEEVNRESQHHNASVAELESARKFDTSKFEEELPRVWQEATIKTQEQADVMSQLKALEQVLSQEVLKTSRKMQDLENASIEVFSPRAVCSPGQQRLRDLESNLNGNNMKSHVLNGTNGKIYDAKGSVYEVGTGVKEPPRDQILEAQIRFVELRQQRSSLGAKIHAKFADVNLSLEKYRLSVEPSEILDPKTLRDAHFDTACKLKLLQKEWRISERFRRSWIPREDTDIQDLKEVRQQQGPHVHFEGDPVLPTDLPKRHSMLNEPPRSNEIKKMIGDLKKSRAKNKLDGSSKSHKYPSSVDDAKEICGRPGWFRS